MRCLVKFYLTLLFFIISFNCSSITKTPDFQFKNTNNIFISLDQRHGLSQPSILSMAQDDLGYIWVGTQGGLNRYDSYNFTTFPRKSQQITELNGNYITALCSNKNHQMWIGTLSGVSRYNYKTGILTNFHNTSNKSETNRIFQLSCQGEHIVVGTYNEGVYTLNSETGDTIPNSQSKQFRVNALQYKNDITYIATKTGVYIQYKYSGKLEKVVATNAASLAIYKDWLYVVTINGHIQRYHILNDSKELKLEWDNSNEADNLKMVNQIIVQNEHLWLSSKNGLYQLDLNANLIRHYQHNGSDPNSLINNHIISLLALGNQYLWIGTLSNGINHLDLHNSQFGHINRFSFDDNTTFNHDIRALEFDQDANVWLGTPEGLYISNGKEIKYASYYYPELKPLDHMFITSIKIYQGILWLTTFNNGVIKYDFATQEIVNLYTPPPRVAKTFVSLDILNDEVITVASNYGIFKINSDTNQLEPFRPAQEKLPASFHSIKAIDNALWAGTFGHGVYKFNQAETTTFSKENNSPTNTIYSFAQAKNKNIWVSSDKGIMVLTPEMTMIKHINANDGLDNETVWDLVADKQGNIWAGTSGGLSKINEDNFSIVNYGILDGVQGLEFNLGPAKLSPSGRVFMGGINGFNQFNPNKIKQASKLTQPKLSDITVLGESISPTHHSKTIPVNSEFLTHLNLNYKQDILSFTYTELDYSGQKLQYFYRVIGLSDDWILMNKDSRQFNLMKLPPGDYTIEVYVKNANGLQSDSHQLKLTLVAPWWWNNYSKFIYFLLIASLIYWFYSLRQQAYLNLEQTVVSRTKQLSIKNDKLETAMLKLQQAQSSLVESEKMAALGGLVAGLAHEINTPLGIVKTAVSHNQGITNEIHQLIKDKKLTSKKLQQSLESESQGYQLVESNLERAIHLVSTFKQVAVDQSTEAVREVNLTEYLTETMDSLKPLLRSNNIKIKITGDDDLNVSTYPGPLYQILSNLVNNSIKHGFENSSSGNITVSIAREGNDMTIVYSDDGIGMEQEILEQVYEPFMTTKRNQGGSGLGMHIVFNLITQLFKGSINCHSSPNNGVTFTIKFPPL